MLVPVPSQLGRRARGPCPRRIGGSAAARGDPLITAGGLVAAGHLALPVVIPVAALAAIVGDTIGYWLGRRGGRALLLRDGPGAAHRRHAVARADRFFARHGAATVFFGRWVPGVRVVAALTAGAATMPWRRFAVANAAGALAWAATMATLAVLAGPTGAVFLALCGLAFGALTFVAALRSRRRRARTPGGARVQVAERVPARP